MWLKNLFNDRKYIQEYKTKAYYGKCLEIIFQDHEAVIEICFMRVELLS